MRRVILAVAVFLSACATTNAGIPRVALNHCEDEANKAVSKYERDTGRLLSNEVRTCAFLATGKRATVPGRAA